MAKEPRKCEICGIKFAKYKCVKCGKEACPACYWLQFGLCRKCTAK